MTQLQKTFAEEYVKDYNATAAYMRASSGCKYSTANIEGPKLIKRTEIIDYIKELQAENVKRFGDLAEVIAKELIDDVVFRDNEGKHSPSWQRSAELLQKQLGLQNQKIDVSAQNGFNITILGGEDD